MRLIPDLPPWLPEAALVTLVLIGLAALVLQ